MTGSAGESPDPLDGATAQEVDARFAEIVAGFGVTTGPADSADTTAELDDPTELDDAARRMAEQRTVADDDDPYRVDPRITDRERRRAIRRFERAEEVRAFEADQQWLEHERASDTEHFVPPEPPPLPKPKRRTVVSLLFLALGVFVLIRPNLLAISFAAAMVIGLVLLLAGCALLLAGLRAKSIDADPDEGWDDGAQL